jgi:hypothetical protein
MLAVDEGSPPKQRHTGQRVFERLCDEFGYKGGVFASICRHGFRDGSDPTPSNSAGTELNRLLGTLRYSERDWNPHTNAKPSPFATEHIQALARCSTGSWRSAASSISTSSPGYFSVTGHQTICPHGNESAVLTNDHVVEHFDIE